MKLYITCIPIIDYTYNTLHNYHTNTEHDNEQLWSLWLVANWDRAFLWLIVMNYICGAPFGFQPPCCHVSFALYYKEKQVNSKSPLMPRCIEEHWWEVRWVYCLVKNKCVCTIQLRAGSNCLAKLGPSDLLLRLINLRH